MRGETRGPRSTYKAWVDAERDVLFALFAFCGHGVGEDGDAAAVGRDGVSTGIS